VLPLRGNAVARRSSIRKRPLVRTPPHGIMQDDEYRLHGTGFGSKTGNTSPTRCRSMSPARGPRRTTPGTLSMRPCAAFSRRAADMGTLEEVLEESGYRRIEGNGWQARTGIVVERRRNRNRRVAEDAADCAHRLEETRAAVFLPGPDFASHGRKAANRMLCSLRGAHRPVVDSNVSRSPRLHNSGTIFEWAELSKRRILSPAGGISLGAVLSPCVQSSTPCGILLTVSAPKHRRI